MIVLLQKSIPNKYKGQRNAGVRFLSQWFVGGGAGREVGGISRVAVFFLEGPNQIPSEAQRKTKD